MKKSILLSIIFGAGILFSTQNSNSLILPTLVDMAYRTGFEASNLYLTHPNKIKGAGLLAAGLLTVNVFNKIKKYFKEVSLEYQITMLSKFYEFGIFINKFNLNHEDLKKLVEVLNKQGINVLTNIQSIKVMETDNSYPKNNPISRFRIIVKAKNLKLLVVDENGRKFDIRYKEKTITLQPSEPLFEKMEFLIVPTPIIEDLPDYTEVRLENNKNFKLSGEVTFENIEGGHFFIDGYRLSNISKFPELKAGVKGNFVLKKNETYADCVMRGIPVDIISFEKI